jgi:hypothetical protein
MASISRARGPAVVDVGTGGQRAMFTKLINVVMFTKLIRVVKYEGAGRQGRPPLYKITGRERAIATS